MRTAACLSAVALLLAASFAHAATASATGPMSPTGLTGMWMRKQGGDGSPRVPMPLSALGKAAQDKEAAKLAAGEVIGTLKCDPVGMPGMMTNEFALQFLEIPGRIVIVSEMSPLSRQVYLGKPQGDGGNGPMFNGHSVGRWEGKTLVIDTVNFQEPENPIVFGGLRSASLHLTERYHVEDAGQTLVGELTFEDPKLLSQPYKTTVTFERLPNDAELWEYACLVGGEGWQDRFAGDTAAAKK